jgi:hypothetical protein
VLETVVTVKHLQLLGHQPCTQVVVVAPLTQHLPLTVRQEMTVRQVLLLELRGRLLEDLTPQLLLVQIVALALAVPAMVAVLVTVGLDFV